jgi:hypothetical protein
MNLSEFAQDGSILTEINMSPSSLRQLASNINATVGIEFEMIYATLWLPVAMMTMN